MTLRHEFFSYKVEHQDITMISLYGLFILLLTVETIYAQGDTDEGDDGDQASGSNPKSKTTTSLPLRVHPLRLPKTLWGTKAPDQNGALSSVDPQPGKECKDGYWIRKITKLCPQQQSPPESQPSTLHDPPQSDEMPLPDYLGKSEKKSYSRSWKTKQYRLFTKGETRYFESEYFGKKTLGQGQSGVVYLAIRKSDGMEVAYKSIPKSKVRKYTLEFSPPPRCHLPSPLVGSEDQSVAQCMSPRPPNLLVPHEFLLQMYLSRPGYENLYVPVVFDYFILENEYILVMEYVDENWVSLSKYVKEKGQLDINEARNIVKEIVNAMIFLKQNGVVHDDLSGMSQ
ncbi:hypothetical protein BASA50_010023 [Batrachochytrium salamandrivorans]|uniref:non-specific serine/threonine protein kinase n=1 Tax=Batrachochytrium salamandrivorans TaxID=1357716 RepID=A0ABQ8EZM3_9FUNG|nr:hypothetical protein BASA50_010023 [Batrachochytrium salamandrivorans]